MTNRFSDALQNSRNPYLYLWSVRVHASKLSHKIGLPGELEIFMNQCVGAETSGQSQQVSGSGAGNVDPLVKARLGKPSKQILVPEAHIISPMQ